MVASELIQIHVGRSEQNDLTIPHPSVSSHHCIISFLDGEWSLEDLKSTNGTFINGVRVNHQILNNGDQVLIGLVAFRFTNGELKLEATHSDAPFRAEANSPTGKYRLTPKMFALLGLLSSALVAIIVMLGGHGESLDSATVVSPETDLFSQPAELSGIIDVVRDSIFGVECGDSGGTGWVLTIGDTALIVTNHHVVVRCIGVSSPQIVIDGAKVAVTIVSSDENTDLAVLKSSRKLTGLPTASSPPVGSWLMVIGNPIGLDRSINYGTLTNKAEGFLITDAAINPGNSGGPVFNSRGEVIGVASAKLVADGIERIGLVIPLSDLCLQVLECEVGQWAR
jgi:S1-C subfamily serine protease